MAVSLAQFQQRLIESGLLTAADLQALFDDLTPKQRPKDGEEFARLVVKRKLLTAFQAQQIYLGKGKSLVLGNYVVLDKLGQGGMGMVLKALHRRMERIVALKILSPEVTKTTEALARFQREVKAAAKLEHPNIVTAYDADEAGGTHFLVMQYVAGTDLSALVKEKGPLGVEKALACVLQAARGLEYAHIRGVVHRDIKPSNLLLDGDGTVQILDMGLARLESAGADQDQLTGTGQIMGTVDYMAPEQAMDTHTADARADIYSLGMTLWYLLTGRPAYQADSVVKKLMAHQHAEIPSLQAACPQVSAALEAVFARMVAKKPAERFQNMSEVIAELERCTGSGTPAPSLASAPGDDTRLNEFLQALDPSLPSVATQATAKRQAPAKKKKQKKQKKKTPDESAFEPTVTLQSQPENTDPETQQSLVSPPATLAGVTASREKPGRSWTRLKGRTAWIAGGAALLLLLAVVFWPGSGTDGPGEPKEVDASEGGGVAAPNLQLAFDGVDDYVEIPMHDVELGEQFTIEAWIDFGAAPADAWQTLFQWQGNVIVTADQSKDGSISVSIREPQLARYQHAYTEQPVTGRRHVAVVSKDGVLAFYVDGEAGHAPGPTRIEDEASQPEAAFRLGALFSSGSWFRGHVDEVHISSVARYEHAGFFAIPERFEADEHTIALYHCDESSGTKLIDASGNGHHGTIHGNPKWVPVDQSAGDDAQEVPPQPVRTIPLDGKFASEFDVARKGQRVLVRQNGPHTCVVYDIASGESVARLTLKPVVSQGNALETRLSPDGRFASLSIADGRLLLWEVDGDGPPRTLTAKHLFERQHEFTPDSSKLLIRGDETTLVLFDVATGAEAGRLTGVPTGAAVPAFSPDSQRLYVPESGGGGQLWAWDLATRQRIDLPRPLPGAYVYAVSPDGDRLARPGGDDVESFAVDRDFEPVGDPIPFDNAHRLEYGRDEAGRLVLLAAFHGCTLFDVETGAARWQSDHRYGWVGLVDDDGTGHPRIVTVDAERGIEVWAIPPRPGDDGAAEAPPTAVAPFEAAQAKAHQQAWADYLGIPVEKDVELPGGEKMTMVLIPPGEFLMGSPAEEQARYLEEAQAAADQWAIDCIPSEGPQHRVRITKPFYLGKYEVTQAQWQSVMGNNPSKFEGNPTHPVEQVSWDEIQPFLVKLNENTVAERMTFSLPTEAQWEYACRSGTTTAHYGGDRENDLRQYGWFSPHAGVTTHPVGELRANGFGVYDMHGNVWELCADWFAGDYYAKAPLDDPSGPSTDSNRVVHRGGYWGHRARLCRSASRGDRSPGYRSNGIGFRLAAMIDVDHALAEKMRAANAPQLAVAPFATAQAQVHQQSWAAYLGLPVEKDVQLPGGEKMTFMLIPPGEFLMGSTDKEVDETLAKLTQKWRENDIKSEAPQHRVQITKPFYMGPHEVTVGQFKAFVEAESYKTEAERLGGAMRWSTEKSDFFRDPKSNWRDPGFPQTDNHPVVTVTAADVTAFCEWLSKKLGRTVRLPTEAEWEYACRAGTTTAYAFGNDLADEQAHVAQGRLDTVAVDTFPPNAFGLYHMHGNAYERCRDWYSQSYYGKSPLADPTGPTSGDLHVVRGGAVMSTKLAARSADRHGATLDFCILDLGFRVVMPVEDGGD